MTKKKARPSRPVRKLGPPALTKIAQRRLDEIESDRADPWWNVGLLAVGLRDSGRSDDEVSGILWANRKTLRPQLSHWGFDGRAKTHEHRAFALLDYLRECAVLVHDPNARPETRKEAEAIINRQWAAANGFAKVEVAARGLFCGALEKASSDSHAQRSDIFIDNPVGHVALFVALEDRDTATRLRERTSDADMTVLLRAWANRAPGQRAGATGRASKFLLAAKVWNAATGDRATPEQMNSAWKLRKKTDAARRAADHFGSRASEFAYGRPSKASAKRES